MKKLLTVVALMVVIAAGLIAQSPTKTQEQLFLEAEQAHQKFLVMTRELDKKWAEVFPNDPPMAPMVERDHQEFLENKKAMDAADAELTALKTKTDQAMAKADEGLRRFNESKRQECQQVRSDLASGKINSLIVDIWQKMAANCNEWEKRQKK